MSLDFVFSNFSVLDPDCQVRDVDNVYVADGSFVPTGGSVPYPWTIYANALRVGAGLRRKFDVIEMLTAKHVGNDNIPVGISCLPYLLNEQASVL